MALAASLLLVACRQREGSASSPNAAKDFVSALAAANGESVSQIPVPQSADWWILAAPYREEGEFASLGLSKNDVRKLVDASNGIENVLLVAVGSGRVTGTAWLSSDFYVKPSVLVVKGRTHIKIDRRPGSRPLVIKNVD